MITDIRIVNKVKKLRPGAIALLAIALLKMYKDNYGATQKEIDQLINIAAEQEKKIGKVN